MKEICPEAFIKSARDPRSGLGTTYRLNSFLRKLFLGYSCTNSLGVGLYSNSERNCKHDEVAISLLFQWKPCIRYIDPGARTWLSEQSWKPGKKLINPKENAVESEPRTIRKKFLQAVEHPDGSERASYRGPGIFIPRPAWDPPFRKADIGDLQPIRHPRRHLNTYRDEFESRGVKDVLNPNVTVLPAMGKRRLPTYRNEQLSLGVGGAIRLPDFHFRDVP